MWQVGWSFRDFLQTARRWRWSAGKSRLNDAEVVKIPRRVKSSNPAAGSLSAWKDPVRSRCPGWTGEGFWLRMTVIHLNQNYELLVQLSVFYVFLLQQQDFESGPVERKLCGLHVPTLNTRSRFLQNGLFFCFFNRFHSFVGTFRCLWYVETKTQVSEQQWGSQSILSIIYFYYIYYIYYITLFSFPKTIYRCYWLTRVLRAQLSPSAGVPEP